MGKQKAAKLARCGKCKNCLNPESKRKCTNPRQGQQAAATSEAFSSPVARRRRPAGSGSGVVVSSSVVVDLQWTPAPTDSTPESTPAPLQFQRRTRAEDHARSQE